VAELDRKPFVSIVRDLVEVLKHKPRALVVSEATGGQLRETGLVASTHKRHTILDTLIKHNVLESNEESDSGTD